MAEISIHVTQEEIDELCSVLEPAGLLGRIWRQEPPQLVLTAEDRTWVAIAAVLISTGRAGSVIDKLERTFYSFPVLFEGIRWGLSVYEKTKPCSK